MDSNYNIIRIQQYLQGQLSPEEMYSLERDALDDPFLHDAIEGYRMQHEVNHGTLSLLQQRLAARIENQRAQRDRFFFGGQRLGIAATACVLFVLVVVLFWMRADLWDAANEGAAGISKQVDVELPVLPGSHLGLRMTPLSLADAPPTGEPVGGWAEFGQYLLNQSNWSAVPADRLPRAGTLFAVEFEIDRDGRPVEIQVDTVTTTGAVAPQIRAEIIRLLKEGPAWKGKKSTLQVDFFHRQDP